MAKQLPPLCVRIWPLALLHSKRAALFPVSEQFSWDKIPAQFPMLQESIAIAQKLV
jgi:hypothetical protein